MIKNVFLGLGPMSIEIINSINLFSKKYNKKIMLICSRNQIEAEELGGGYVNNFNTESFSKFIKKKNNDKLILSRDHSGPYKKDGRKKNITDEIEDCKISLKNDIINDFKIIHIDTSECKKLKYEIAEELIYFCNDVAKKNQKKIFFEFGCEDHGVLTSFEKFKKDINFFKKFKNRQFIVCQTGSLVKSIFQLGQFDINGVKYMKKIADKNGILLKEHNCDYLNLEQIKLRKKYGISAINIAPELGVIQSNLVYNLGMELNLKNELNEFLNLVLRKKKWIKWNYNNENKLIKFFSAGHYHFKSIQYQNLKLKIERKINIQKRLDKIIEKYLINFF